MPEIERTGLRSAYEHEMEFILTDMERDSSRYLSYTIQEAIASGVTITQFIPSSASDSVRSAGRVMGIKPTGEPYGPTGIHKEKRGVVNVDIVNSTENPNPVQFIKVALLHNLLNRTISKISNMSIKHERLIPTGDGGFLVFKDKPLSALTFSIHLLLEIAKHNQTANDITALEIKLAATWGDAIPFKDAENNDNIIGDAINECARISQCPCRLPGNVLISENFFKEVIVGKNLAYNGIFTDEAKESMGLSSSDIIEYDCLGKHKVKKWEGIVYKIFGNIQGVPVGS